MANENKNEQTNVEVWEVKAGNVTAVKMFDRVFHVNEKSKLTDVLGIAENFADAFLVEATDVQPEKKKVGRPKGSSNQPRTFAPRAAKHKRVPQSRSDDYTPILDKKGEHIKISGIPLYEEFKKVIMDNFKPETNFSTRDITDLFMEKFPEYSMTTLRNKAVAYDRYLREANIARYTEIDGVKRKIAINAIQSATPNDILQRQTEAESESGKLLEGINA